MSLVITRPDVGDLIFHVYNRPIHPELIQRHDELVIAEDDYSCVVRLHDAGHFIEFRHGDILISEVMSSRNHPLPQHGLELQHTVRGSRDSELIFNDLIRYQSSFQLERLDSEIFLNFHQELQTDFRRACLAREYPGQGRFAPGPISLVRTEITLDSFLIHTYHTYPENCAVVKTQTLIEFCDD
jgi:hypothetical protein